MKDDKLFSSVTSENLSGMKTHSYHSLQKTICLKKIHSNVSPLFLLCVLMFFLIIPIFAEDVKTCLDKQQLALS